MRSLFAFFASFVALGYLAAISHMAFVAHAVCAEHGELVHVEAAIGPSSDRAGDTSASAPRALSVDVHPSDDHDHCVLGVAPPGEGSVERGAPRVVVLPPDPAETPPIEAPAWSPPPVAPAPPISILLLSPKSSPPV